MVVGENIRIQGTIDGGEDLVIHGRVEGTIRIEGDVTVEEGAWVVADVRAQTVLVRGTLRGDVRARASVEVARTGRVIGDATAPRVGIAAGAAFRGRVEIGDQPALEETTPPFTIRSVPVAAMTAPDGVPPLARPASRLRRRAE